MTRLRVTALVLAAITVVGFSLGHAASLDITVQQLTVHSTTVSVPGNEDPATLHVAAITGTGSRVGSSSNWKSTLTVTVVDESNVEVSDVQVSGTWSDGTATTACTTGTVSDGSCSVGEDTHNSGATGTWTLSSLTKVGYTQGTPTLTTITCTLPAKSDPNPNTVACGSAS